ncbi:hypothetical protein SCP_0603740 [Sparassis crispa]|uniref:Uncharacterized protein n=1 Tax=Sparassis crispa TaxID=139825 RepID=A0A401GQ81_9APHY|nr:hypothetical protein SCP_0603740 [Sparassis crispa]GBE84395.1 hypothetical protein SCP_0603740 [Sparassis crispa]
MPPGPKSTDERQSFRELFTGVVFDFLTAWDRFTGSSTIMVHTNSTQRPGAAVAPEQVKVISYFSPGLQSELPETSYTIARIIQLFIEGMAIPAIERSHDCEPYRARTLIPSPTRGSLYTFYGHPSGVLETLILDLQGGGVSALPVAGGSVITEQVEVQPEDEAADESSQYDDNAWYERAQASGVLELAETNGLLKVHVSELEKLSQRQQATLSKVWAVHTLPGALSPLWHVADPSSPSPSAMSLTRPSVSSPSRPSRIRSATPSTPRQHHQTAITNPSTPPRLSVDSPLVRTYSLPPLMNTMSPSLSSPSSITHSSRSASREYMATTEHRPIEAFGPATDAVMCSHDIPAIMHNMLWHVERTSATLAWQLDIEHHLQIAPDVAAELARAMIEDLYASQTTGSAFQTSPGVATRPIAPAKCRIPPRVASSVLKDMVNKSQEKTAALEADLTKWYDDAVTYSKTLSDKYGKKSEYYLHMMFTGGASLQNRRKTTAFNSWSHHLAKTANEGVLAGEGSNILELQQENIDDYHSLTTAQKAELVQELEKEKTSCMVGLRLNQCGRTQDVNNVCKKIKALLHGLKCRVGVEGFFCLVRNTTDFHMPPRWYFSSQELDKYLRGAIKKGWDPANIGALAEALAVASCDFMSFLRTSKSKADWLKGEIRDKINTMLVEITGNSKAVMNYVNYERDIVLKYGITLQGWTHEKWANPSDLSTSLLPLRTLLAALESGTCKFEQLTSEELKKRTEEYDQKVAAGEAVARKKRKDTGGKHAGMRRKHRVEAEDADADMEDDDDDEVNEEEVLSARTGEKRPSNDANTSEQRPSNDANTGEQRPSNDMNTGKKRPSDDANAGSSKRWPLKRRRKTSSRTPKSTETIPSDADD